MIGICVLLIGLGAFLAGMESGERGSVALAARVAAAVYWSSENRLPYRLDTATADAEAAAEEIGG